jgi:hypothetical protein
MNNVLSMQTFGGGGGGGGSFTNLSSFIGLYKFYAKFDFHGSVQKLHEFHVMVNMNDIRTYSILYMFK